MTGNELEIRQERQVQQADTGAKVINLWLHGRPATTRRAYEFEVQGFMAAVDKPLRQITLEDLQGYADGLVGLAPASRARATKVIKSLFSFAYKIGYLRFNPGGAIKTPKVKNSRAERIMDESTVHKIINMEPHPRNRALLRLLYAGGLRVSEICGLTWENLQERDGAGQITVHGKGEKTRHILLSACSWGDLVSLRGNAGADDPVFVSRQGGHLDPASAWRVVKAAAKRAGIEAVSPHWLRHAHASHALDRGCPIHVLQATLGHASVQTTGAYCHCRPGDSSAKYLGV